MSRIISKAQLDQWMLESRFENEVTPLTTDTTKLLDIFNKHFKPICKNIGQMLNIENFRGGFDEIQELYKYILELDSSTEDGKRQIIAAHTLAVQWEAADAYCKHEASKLRWKPAEWWKYCWAQADADDTENQLLQA